MIKKLTADQIAGLTADAKEVVFYTFPSTRVTICLVTLKSGFSLVGKSACMNPEDFDKDIGQKVAFEDAREQLWELDGYYRMATG